MLPSKIIEQLATECGMDLSLRKKAILLYQFLANDELPTFGEKSEGPIFTGKRGRKLKINNLVW